MKAIKLLVLTLFLSITSIQNSKAAVAGVMAIAGSPAAGGVALAGLGSVGVGFIATAGASSCDGGLCIIPIFLGVVVGAIVLDEESGSIEFNEVTYNEGEELNLSKKEIEIYNSEVEEANIVFSEVLANLAASSSVEDSRELWTEFSEFVSPETFIVMKRLAVPERNTF